MINEASHSSQHPSVELPFDRLFTVRTDLDIETLLANASQDLASINVITANLAFDVDGTQRSVTLGICRMLEGVQLLVDRALDACEMRQT